GCCCDCGFRIADCAMDVPASELIRRATDAVAGQLGSLRPRVAIVLGSGLGSLSDAVQSAIRTPESPIPGFPGPGGARDQGARGRGARVRRDDGVCAGLLGPSDETPAEVRMLQRLGADAVGMSTVPEVIAARARGMQCLGFSTITNLAAGLSPTPLAHAEVLEVGKRVAGQLGTLIKGVLRQLG